MTQYSRPTLDLFSDWLVFPTSPATSWDKTDEGILGASPDDDTTYIHAPSPARSFTCMCNGLVPPGVTTGHKMSVRLKYFRPKFVKPLLSMFVATVADGVVSQKQVFGSTSWNTTTFTLTAAEAAAMTDYGNIAMNISWQSGTVRAGGWVRVTGLEFECPDPPTAAGKSNKWWSGWRHS